jgi:cytoskeletal protein CcmA (bactofilin family)
VRKGEKNSKVGAAYGENKPGAIEIDGDDVPISTKTKKSVSTDADENITSYAKKAIVQKSDQGISRQAPGHNFVGDVRIKGNLYISGEGYKPSDGPWLAGSAVMREDNDAYELEMRGQVDRAAVPSMSLDEDGTVVFRRPVRFEGGVRFEGDVEVAGNLTVRGKLTAVEDTDD